MKACKCSYTGADQSMKWNACTSEHICVCRGGVALAATENLNVYMPALQALNFTEPHLETFVLNDTTL